MIGERFETKHLWAPYLRYEPPGIDATDEAVAAFIKGDSQFCDMCSVEYNYVSLEGIIPRDTIGELQAALGSELKKRDANIKRIC